MWVGLRQLRGTGGLERKEGDRGRSTGHWGYPMVESHCVRSLHLAPEHVPMTSLLPFFMLERPDWSHRSVAGIRVPCAVCLACGVTHENQV